jgi:hypothetical protein
MDSSLLNLDKDSLSLIFEELNPLSVIRLCSSSKKLREFCDRYNKWTLVSGQFEKMSGDTLFAIQKHMEPYQVVTFCGSSPGFTRVCNRGNFWTSILRHHYGIDSQNARRTYLELTNLLFLINMDEYKTKKVTDDLGHTFNITENFDDHTARLVPFSDSSVVEGVVGLLLKGTEFMRERVWVGVITSNNSPNVKAYRTKEDAIRDFVETHGTPEDFMNMIELLDAENIPEDWVIRNYPIGKSDDIFRNYFNAYNMEPLDDSTENVTFVSQSGLDRLASMGYPQFMAGETIEEARERLYDYINRNGFFFWGGNFSDPNIDPYYIKTFQVFEVKLDKNPPDWWHDDE